MFGRLVAFLSVKLANAFASKTVRQKAKARYASQYAISDTVAEEFRKKHDALEQKRDSIETLALGSSHGYHGFLPDENSFNLCGTSQDLYLSYELYRRFADLPKLNTVVLFYSIFSPGFETERTSEKDYCLYYRYFWGIPLRYLPDRYFACKTKLLEKYLRKHPATAIGDYRGENSYRWFVHSSVSLDSRVESHLKNNNRHNGQTGYVRKMAELAQAKGHRLVVVVPPFRRDFTSRLPPFRQLFAELLELSVDHPEMQIMSFVGDGAFVDSDFGDMDHLNRQGAEKLTIKIKYGLRQRGKVLLPGVEWMEFPVHGNHTGSLVALEARDDFPFDVKRVYYI